MLEHCFLFDFIGFVEVVCQLFLAFLGLVEVRLHSWTQVGPPTLAGFAGLDEGRFVGVGADAEV